MKRRRNRQKNSTSPIIKSSKQSNKNGENSALEISPNVDSDHGEVENLSANVNSSERNNRSCNYSEFFHFKYQDKIKIGVCKLCEKKNIVAQFKMLDSNTTGIKRHLHQKHENSYLKIFPEEKCDKNSQKKLEDFFYQKNKNQILDEEDFRISLVEWIAVKMLPLSIFDDDLTQTFFSQVSPNYQFPRRTAMTNYVTMVHLKMKNIVTELLRKNDSKFSFTIDGWTSIRSKSYYGITIHFIDDQWKMNSLAIDFVPSDGHHAGIDIAELFYTSLNKLDLLDKIMGITVDNTSANKVFVQEFEKILRNKSIEFDAEDQHFQCFGHILNLSVQQILKTLKADTVEDEDIDVSDFDSDSGNADTEKNFSTENSDCENLAPINKLRKICKTLKKSEQLKNQLGHYCILNKEDLIEFPLDVSTRWNSSHDMITAGLKMKKSISALIKNTDFLQCFHISEGEWEIMSILQVHLKSFKKLSEVLSGDKYATLPSVVVGINIILDNIERLCHDLDEKIHRTLIDESVIYAFQAGRDKIIKHYLKSNWIYCAVLILDPRHKLDLFDKTVWGQELKKQSYEYFQKIFETKYSVFELDNDTSLEKDTDEVDDDYTKSLNSLFRTETNVNDKWKRELNHYLVLDRAPQNTNILDWWSQNQNSFPQLAKMARDLLAICATSVPAERLFSKAGLVLRKHRNRLSNNNIEYLLCLNSWFSSSVSTKIKTELKKK